VVIVVVLIAVVGVVAGVLLTSGGGKTATRPGSGRAAPDFTLPDVRDGQGNLTLSSFRGRPVLLNFWAAWCVPCTEEMPLLQAVHQRVGDRVVFLGIDRQDYRPEAVSFLQKTGVTYRSTYDPNATLDGPYRLRGTPTSVFIDADGRIRDQVTGPLTKAQLDSELAALTKGKG
jgi:cytochrome c biogenesis protein CcmG/thiol:disulfide interchange protein DsbE